MTEDEAKAAVIAAAEAVDQHLFMGNDYIRLVDNEDGTIPILKELRRCVAQYRTYQRRVFLVAHGEAANVSLVYYGGRVTLEQPNGEFTTAEEQAMQRFRTATINDNRLLTSAMSHGVLAHHCAELLLVFRRLERVGPWPDGV